MGKHGGLKGNSGLIYNDAGEMVMHISAPYDNNGLLFAEGEPNSGMWERVTPEEVKKRGMHIITCCQCENPATSVDHHCPYYSGQNLCDSCEYDPECDA